MTTLPGRQQRIARFVIKLNASLRSRFESGETVTPVGFLGDKVILVSRPRTPKDRQAPQLCITFAHRIAPEESN